jgi:hypothetical protein
MDYAILRVALASGLLFLAGGAPAAVGAGLDSNARDGAEVEADQVQRWIEQLGDAKFAEREAAARALINAGLPALGPLRDAAQHRDPEIRFRAERILAEVRQRDFHRRLQAFEENLESAEEYDLPGWGEYRGLAGDDRDARDLFAKMQSEETRLMQALEEGPRGTGDMLAIRCLQILQPTTGGTMQPVSLGTAAAIVFAAGQSDAALSDLAASGVYRVAMDEVVRDALNRDPYQDPLRKLLSAWITRESNSNMDYQKLALAMQYELKAGLPPAVQILEQAGSPPHLRQQALVTVAKFGDATHIPLVERYLSDETQYGARRVGNATRGEKQRTVQTEIRDIALASLVALTKQSFADYGMEHVTAAPTYVFIPSTCGFETPEARAKALAKWREFRAQQTAKAPQESKS